jgi:hypothetical protein
MWLSLTSQALHGTGCKQGDFTPAILIMAAKWGMMCPQKAFLPMPSLKMGIF